MIIWSMMAAQMVVQGLPHQPFVIFGVIVQFVMIHFPTIILRKQRSSVVNV